MSINLLFILQALWFWSAAYLGALSAAGFVLLVWYRNFFIRYLYQNTRLLKADKLLRFLKYVILVVFVIIMPMFITDIIGQGSPWFCKLICPAGTLEGGIPLVLLNKAMRATIGWLYAWKNLILVVIIFLSIIIYRPFCKYLCPLGAIYSVFNPVSAAKISGGYRKMHQMRSLCKSVWNELWSGKKSQQRGVYPLWKM